jgi:small-conductance mechanosensitive channel
MNAAENAAEALDKGVGTIESIANWFVSNREDLPIGLGVAAIIVALMLGIRWVGHWLAASDPNCLRWRGVIGRALSKTSLFFMVVAALDIVVSYAEIPARLGRLVDILFIIGFAIQVAVWARELILGTIARRVGDDADTTLGNAASIIRVFVSVALFALAFIVILENLGADVTALVAGLGIGGIAIGLAAQGVFSDLFAALAILFDKPFRRGDTITYDQTTGTVQRIGLKTTRLLSLSGEQVVMANTKLLEREIHNHAEGHSRRTKLLFGLVYQTSPDKIEQLREITRGIISSRSGCSFVRCAILGLGSSSIDFELLFDHATVDIDAVASDRTAIVIDLLRAFALHGLEFAYPTQTTFTAAPDGSLVMPYAPIQPVVNLATSKDKQG